MIDLYSYYVLMLGVGESFFWDAPITEVDRAVENIEAMKAWESNPRTVGGR